jgi:membrane protein implicated in regulation of membrane protease activity
MSTRTPYIDRASTVRPHDPWQRAALVLGAVAAFFGSLYFAGPALGVAILLLVVAGLALVMWVPALTLALVVALLVLMLGRRYVRLVRERVELRERERMLDREIPF